MTSVNEFWPEEVVKEYDRLIEEDRAGISKDSLIAVNCVACGANQDSYSFTKYGFTYHKCLICGTLYLSPRLSREDISKFFRESRAMAFWGEKLMQATIKARKLVIGKRTIRLKKVLEKLNITLPVPRMLEIGPGYGLFLEQMKKHKFAEYIACIEPSPICCTRIAKESLADAIHEISFEEFAGNEKFDMIICHGVIENLFSLTDFLEKARNLLNKEGYIVIASSNADGLDTNALRAATANVDPPEMQNFIALNGWQYLSSNTQLRIAGYESLGELDAELFYNDAKLRNEYQLRAIADLLGDLRFRSEFQRLLQKYDKTGFSTIILSPL